MGHILSPFCGCNDCEGERGERGERGKRGKRGHRGERGERGEQGERGDDGDTGPTGPTGATGPEGATGTTGPGLVDTLPFAASFRVQWNGGDPIVTPKDIVAPPGIFVGFRPLGNRGEGTLFVVGPITRGTAAASIAVPVLAFTTEFLAIVLQGRNFGGSWVVPVDAAGVTGPTPAQVAQAVPALPPVVPGQLVLEITVRTRHQQNGTTDNTSPVLEDIALNFSGAVA